MYSELSIINGQVSNCEIYIFFVIMYGNDELGVRPKGSKPQYKDSEVLLQMLQACNYRNQNPTTQHTHTQSKWQNH